MVPDLYGRRYVLQRGLQISARKNKDGPLDELRITPTCHFPSKGVLYTSMGTPPGKAEDTIKPPVYIPSCPEYQKWFRCQHDAAHEECNGVPDAAPSCPAENPDFPKADYPVKG